MRKLRKKDWSLHNQRSLLFLHELHNDNLVVGNRHYCKVYAFLQTGNAYALCVLGTQLEHAVHAVDSYALGSIAKHYQLVAINLYLGSSLFLSIGYTIRTRRHEVHQIYMERIAEYSAKRVAAANRDVD